MITEKEIRNLEDILLRFGEAHNMLAKTSLSKEEYQPISTLLASAKVELFKFYNGHKAALQNKVSDEEKQARIDLLEPINTIKDLLYEYGKYFSNFYKSGNPYPGFSGNTDIECVDEFLEHIKDEPFFKQENKVSDISAEKWKVFSHTSALGNTGDYMSDCGIENGTISFYCDKPDDITNEELQEICDSLNSSIVNERKDNAGSWVSVEDRLPDVKKDGNKVLLFREMNESQKALSICVHDTSMIKYCEKSSYWMPLPAPPVPKIK